MEYHVKNKRGYLLIIAVVLITVMSFIGVLLTHIFENQTNTSTHSLTASQALYLALSGLDIAKRDVVFNNVACNAINASHNNEALLNGQFSVTGTETITSSNLATSMTSSSANIQLTNADAFAASGIVLIGNEEIYYASKSGNVLNQLTRGKMNTAVVDHSSGALVTQNQCVLVSTGAIPSMDDPAASRKTVSSVLIRGVGTFNGGSPAIASQGNANLTGNASVANSGVVQDGEGYAGSTIISYGTVTFDSSGSSTEVLDVNGNLVPSSSRGNILSDVTQSYTSPNSVFETYFGSQTLADIQAIAQSSGQYYTSFNENTINGVVGEVIYIDSDASMSGVGNNPPITIGSPTQPAILVINGTFSMAGNSHIIIYGMIYATGNFSMTGSSEVSGAGAIATSGTLNMSGHSQLAMINGPGDSTLEGAFDLVPGSLVYVTQGLGVQQVVQ